MTGQHHGPPAPLPIEGTYNFREIGGYPVAGGGQTRAGALYRSDALAGLTEAGRASVADLGLRRILDLRSGPELATDASAIEGLGIEVQHHPVLKAAAPRAQTHRRHSLETLYRLMVERRGQHLTDVVRAMSAADGPVLVHCTAGKDRTGLVVALILTAIGIDEETVVADYAATQANLAGEWTEGMLRKVRRFRVPVTDNLLEVLAHSPEAALRDTLDWLDDEHGGVTAYLQSIGVDDTVVTSLRTALLPVREMGG